ncbi:hypothetical protein XENOCAPTIV_019497 [Xenoophorus captivus]|uniref:Uncharacterized protein n=1 Tax=Xenoophorus captivus TaxID=1517983 RepID=A0ABV0QSN8_9TELE
MRLTLVFLPAEAVISGPQTQAQLLRRLTEGERLLLHSCNAGQGHYLRAGSGSDQVILLRLEVADLGDTGSTNISMLCEWQLVGRLTCVTALLSHSLLVAWTAAMTSVSCCVSLQAKCRALLLLPLLSTAAL